ncbi:hypothetical protein GCM10022393_32520 [Aquimarina addita]|uniref:Lipoprotein n=2 Tax=Aquimarina addita TaxID=870485 RepID=A0ABP6UP46_9FLAO
MTLILIFSCNSVKKTEKALNTGDYDEAISIALSKLSANKNKKGKQPYMLMLEEAFAKAVQRDLNAIDFLEKEGNSANLERIYNTYNTLKNRQERISPILPLYHVAQKRKVDIVMDNYNERIIATKKKLSIYLYQNANTLISKATTKVEYRDAYDDLIYLNKITPNYKDTNTLIEEAHYKGTDFVKVTIRNKTNVIIPKRLEADLLNFDTYGLDDLWTVYHSKPQRSITYDYAMEVALRRINISPEKIRERQLEKEKVVKDGWEYLTNNEGEFILGEDGKKIKVDTMKKVRCEYYEYTQYKRVNISGNVQYKNISSKQLLDAFPLSSEYVFQHVYANYNGDKRALDDDLRQFLGLQAVRFPTNEQMVYDSGEDLKNKLRNIIKTYQFN